MKILKNLKMLVALPALILLFSAGSANAVVYNFGNISANSATNATIGESQLTVDITDAGGGQVLFTFANSGPDASSITDVYFDDGTLLGIAGLIDADDGVGGDAGVDYTQLASPGDLPSGNSITPNFETTAGFSADSDPPAQPNGVNPGETLGVLFDLINGKTFADTIAAMGTDLRIGIHVQGFADGGSESFVSSTSSTSSTGGNTTTSSTGGQTGVPEPSVLALLGFGLLSGLLFRRKIKV